MARVFGCCSMLAGLLLMVQLSDAEPRAEVRLRSEEHMSFDIPAQSLSAALSTYAQQTGLSVLYDGALAVGRQSHTIQGEFQPEEALQRLLAGTHLVARYTVTGAFTLVPGETPVVLDGEGADAPAIEVSAEYARNVQSTLEHALCESRETQPGDYRAVVQLWLGTSGQVERARLLHSTGVTKRDAAIESSMKALRLTAPPPGFEQPLTILLLPRNARSTAVCAADSADVH